MRYGETRSGVAFDVREQFRQRALIDESRDDETRVVEYAPYVDVGRRVPYLVEVIGSGREVASDRTEFRFGVPSAEGR